MLTSAVTVPIYGKLSDVYGRRPLYIFGLVVFGVGSVLCGAGSMMSIFNPRERARWMGVMGAAFGLSSILGPTIGGWITDAFSWRWVFYITLPMAVLAIIGVVYSLPSGSTVS